MGTLLLWVTCQTTRRFCVNNPAAGRVPGEVKVRPEKYALQWECPAASTGATATPGRHRDPWASGPCPARARAEGGRPPCARLARLFTQKLLEALGRLESDPQGLNPG